PARATDFTDYAWTLQCASLQPAQLVMDTCFAGSCDSAFASFVAPLPGTFTLDMHYEIEKAQGLTGLHISVDSSQSAFNFGSEWGGPGCPHAPCSGDVTGIVIPVQAGNVVLFSLDATEEGCVGNNGTRCTFGNLQFWPEVGIHP